MKKTLLTTREEYNALKYGDRVEVHTLTGAGYVKNIAVVTAFLNLKCLHGLQGIDTLWEWGNSIKLYKLE